MPITRHHDGRLAVAFSAPAEHQETALHAVNSFAFLIPLGTTTTMVALADVVEGVYSTSTPETAAAVAALRACQEPNQ